MRILFTLLIALFLVTTLAWGQTSLISPAGDGVLELGSALTDNEWTGVASVQTFVGGTPTSASVGTNFAYTSTTAGSWALGTGASLPHIIGSSSNNVMQTLLELSVDMGNQTVSPDGVHVAGSFNGWSTVSTVMTQVYPASSYYHVWIYVDEYSVHDYKFINGNDWTDSEIVPEACGFPDGSGDFNRYVFVTTGMNVTDMVCFGECALCGSGSTKTLNISLFLEGLYEGIGTMHEAYNDLGEPQFGFGIADQIIVELHNETDYSTIEYSIANVDLDTYGTASINVPATFSGWYWLTIKHRNSIETVSASLIYFGSNYIAYDFANNASMAFGDNMKNLGYGIYGIWGGDINQDGIVDSGDMNPVCNADGTPGYVIEDVNGDGWIDLFDVIIVKDNSTSIIMVQKPQ